MREKIKEDVSLRQLRPGLLLPQQLPGLRDRVDEQLHLAHLLLLLLANHRASL